VRPRLRHRALTPCASHGARRDFYGREWNQRVPPSLSPSSQDANPWCPPEFTQDGFTYFPRNVPHAEQVCRQVCLPPKYENIATHHGLILGSTCYKQGCTVFTDAKKVIAGVKVFQFSCPQGHVRPSFQTRAPGGHRR
jgi:hypothetical protein